MKSSTVTMYNEKESFDIRRYLPKLQQAPDYATPLHLPLQMPKLVAAPDSKKTKRKRRNSDQDYKESYAPYAISLDDASISSQPKRVRRTKQEIIDARIKEFVVKQAEEMKRIKKKSDPPQETQAKKKHPQIKFTHLDFNIVLNIAYACSKQHKMFKCISNWCHYKTTDDENFCSHLTTQHLNDEHHRSHAFCQICNSKIDAKSILDEYNHMMKHADKEKNLESLIQLLDAKDETSDVKNDNKLNLDEKLDLDEKIFGNVILKARKSPVPDLINGFDDVEANLMKIFEESDEPDVGKKIEILSVEALPNIEIFEKIGELEESNAAQLRVSNLTKTAANLQSCKDEIVTTVIKAEETHDIPHGEVTTEKSSRKHLEHETDKNPQTEPRIENNRDLDESKKIIKNASQSDKNEIIENISSVNKNDEPRSTVADDCKYKTDTQSLLRHAQSTGGTPEPNKTYKRSLSFARRFDQHSETKSREIKKSCVAKTLDSEYIDKLLVEEKTALKFSSPRESSDEMKSPSPRIEATKRRESAINFEASTSKVSPNASSVSSPDSTSSALGVEMSLIMFKNSSLNLKRQHSESPSDVFKLSPSSKLMPWIDGQNLRSNCKFEICYRKMLCKSSLVALFKCMDKRCSYATSNVELFLNHLNCHQHNATKIECFYLYCSYCVFKSSDTKTLAHHINDCHMTDRFQCSQCFYRSRDKDACYQHIQLKHDHPSTKIYECAGREIDDRAKAIIMERLKIRRAGHVSPIRCQCEFHNLENFKRILISIKELFRVFLCNNFFVFFINLVLT